MADEKLNPQCEVVKMYLEMQIQKDEVLRANYVPEKIKDCFNYIKQQARKQATGGCAMIEDSVEDISYQARMLNQCLITNDYVGKVISKQCYLVFIRKNGCPIATAQLFKGDKIGQFYCNQHNKNYIPNKRIKAVMNKWIEMKEAA